MFTCERCGFSTKYKHVLIRHLHRKETCPPTEQDIEVNVLLSTLVKTAQKVHGCKYCGKKFADSANRYRHQKTCAEKPSCSENHHGEHRSIHIDTQNIQNQTNIAQQNVIVLNNFGNESYDHIDEHFLEQCVKAGHVQGVRNLIEKIHFCDKAAENKNIRMKSIKNKLVEVANNQQWVVRDASDATETMITKGGRLLHKYCFSSDALKTSELDDEIYDMSERLQNFMKVVFDRESKQYYALRRRILALLIEHSDFEY